LVMVYVGYGLCWLWFMLVMAFIKSGLYNTYLIPHSFLHNHLL
jgi:hypothetical protein